MLANQPTVEPHHSVVIGGAHVENGVQLPPRARHTALALVPNQANVLALLRHLCQVIVRRRHRHRQSWLWQACEMPLLSEADGGCVEAETPKPVERHHLTALLWGSKPPVLAASSTGAATKSNGSFNIIQGPPPAALLGWPP